MLMLKLKLKLKLKKIMLFLIGIHISFSLQSVKFISSDNSSGEIRIWKLNKRQPIEKKIVDKDAKTIYLEDYNEDNNHLALQLTKGQQGKKFFIAIYDLTQSKIIFQLPLKHKANFVRFIPSIKNVFAFSSDRSFKIYNFEKKKSKHAVFGYTDETPPKYFFNPDKPKIVLANKSYGINIKEMRTYKETEKLLRHYDNFKEILFCPNNSNILCALLEDDPKYPEETAQKKIHVLNLDKDYCIKKLKITSGKKIVSFCFEPQGKFLIIESNSGMAQKWCTNQAPKHWYLEMEFEIDKNHRFENRLSISDDGKNLITYSKQNSEIKIWNLKKGQLKKIYQHKNIKNAIFLNKNKPIKKGVENRFSNLFCRCFSCGCLGVKNTRVLPIAEEPSLVWQ